MKDISVTAMPVETITANTLTEVSDVLNKLMRTYESIYPNATFKRAGGVITMRSKTGSTMSIVIVNKRNEPIEHWESVYFIHVYGIDFNLTIPHSTKPPTDVKEPMMLFDMLPYLELKYKDQHKAIFFKGDKFNLPKLCLIQTVKDTDGNYKQTPLHFSNSVVDKDWLHLGYLALMSHERIGIFIPVNVHQTKTNKAIACP